MNKNEPRCVLIVWRNDSGSRQISFKIGICLETICHFSLVNLKCFVLKKKYIYILVILIYG